MKKNENKMLINTTYNIDAKMSQKELKFIDLFCGIGGFHQALSNIGCKCVFACDIDKNCRKTYRKNYKIKPKKDITKIDINEIPKFDILCAGFPCFVAGTKVLTNNGYKNIEHVDISDKLLTHNGKFQNILNIQKKMYNSNALNIQIKYHPNNIICTPEHPFYVREKIRKWNTDKECYDISFSDPKWINAENLTINHYVGMTINKNNIIPSFFFNDEQPIITLDNINYLFAIGFIVGNGWNRHTYTETKKYMNKISFVIKNNKNKDVILNNIGNISSIIKISNKKYDGYDCYDFTLLNVLDYFEKLVIPEWLHNAPKEYIREFINGYLMSGRCNIMDKIIQLETISYDFAMGLQRLFLKLGYIFSVTYYEQSVYKVIGDLSKKSNELSFIDENNYVWYEPKCIRNVHVHNQYVFNFEVDNDNSYAIENVIVHNCQPFSKAGFQKGFDDENRGNLFFNICDIVKKHKPKYVILENVKNLSSHDNGNTWNIIKKNIDELGYNTYDEPLILNVLHFNVPQNRERVAILCKRRDLGDLPKKPKINKIDKSKLKCSIKDIIYNNENNDKYIINSKLKTAEKIWNNFITILKENNIDMPKFPIWTDWWDSDGENTSITKVTQQLSDDEKKQIIKKQQKTFYKKYKNWIDKNRSFYEENINVLKPWLLKSRSKKLWIGAVRKFEWQAGNLDENSSMYNVLWSARGSGIRVKKLDYSPTLVAMSMIPVYGPESRILTPRELCRLQSFPDEFIFDTNDKIIYKQLGNAVNVKMIEKCARFLLYNEKLFDK